MPNTSAAKKALRQNVKQRARNRWQKARIKEGVTTLLEAIQSGDAAKAGEAFKKAASVLDKVASKKTIHKNTAARRQSRLAKRLNAMSKAAPST